MGIGEEQYNLIIAQYDRIRNMNRREEILRREEIYEKLPEYRALDQETASFSIGELKRRLSSGKKGDSSVGDRLQLLKERKRALLTASGYPADYLDPIYTCPLCRDTGFIDASPCSCFKEKEQEVLIGQSRLKTLLETENFSRLSYAWHQGKALEWFKNAVERAKAFVREFPQCRNLLFFGTVGTGKSFLSCCIAAELIHQGHSVFYYQAAEYFDALAERIFRNGEGSSAADRLSACELLILDDLGSELTNQFTLTALFELLNRRFLRQEPLIISTNLNLQDLRDRYSDRIFSRIVSGFEVIELTGEDIRIKKLNPGG